MIKPQIIKENGKPKAVILEYKEYLKLKELAEDNADYLDAIEAEIRTKKLTSLDEVKKRILR
jgi:hypothetical protein